MVEYLIRLLGPTAQVATLSRGYGRHTKGIRIATASDTPATLGDEPYQFFRKYGDRVVVAVGEERALAVPYILDHHPHTEVILLDDAFQHRRITPGFQILLTDYNRPFFKDYLLPAGRLRESAKGAERADVIVVTKCPATLTEEERMEMEDRIRLYSSKPVFFTTLRYSEPVSATTGKAYGGEKVLLVSGIANPAPLESYVSRHFPLVSHLRYRDHHDYSEADLKHMAAMATRHEASILTTEKDISKLVTGRFSSLLSHLNVFYIPVSIEFLKNGKEFDERIADIVRRSGSEKMETDG